MNATVTGRGFDESIWDRKEMEWTGKTFYVMPVKNLFGKPLGLNNKLVQLNNELRTGGYKAVNQMTLIQFGTGLFFSGRIMLEVTKQEKYDAGLVTYEIPTQVVTMVYQGDPMGLAKGFESLKELVFSRRGMEARELYYAYVPHAMAANFKTVLFALT